MGLTDQETVALDDPNNVFQAGDYQIIIRHFEIESSQWKEEDYVWASHYRDVYSTENFAVRVRQQMDYYPGMHNPNTAGGPDPFQTNAKQMGDATLNYWNQSMVSPDAFMAGLKGRQRDVDWGEIFTDPSVKNIGAAITECIPCFDRIFDGAQLLPDADLLEIHLLNIRLRFDLLDKLMDLLKNPGYNIDICKLLEMFSHLCPADLLAILAVLSQYLAKLNLDFNFNLDLIIELLGPILSPFLDALSQWLDKWVQMIIAPIICVIDNINQTIYIAQQFKLPFSESKINLDYSIGSANSNIFKNIGAFSDAQSKGGFSAGTGDGAGGYSPYAEGYGQAELFNQPDSQMYNPQPPEVPQEEWDFAWSQIQNDVGVGTSDLTKEEQQKMWEEIKARKWAYENQIPPPLQTPRNDGTRWSPDDIPLSEKLNWSKGFTSKNNPPENQAVPKAADEYYIDAGALIDPIIQVRNIIQGAIQYVKDWFEWVTQLIYDLLGVDFGWMNKKMGQTMLKTNIIQLIYMIEALLSAIAKNGLKCGINSNFDESQLRYILEKQFTKQGAYTFKALPDGSFELVPPVSFGRDLQDVSDAAQGTVQTEDTGAASTEQKTAGSGIIIKDCLKEVSSSDLKKVRDWIADFERRSMTDGD